MQPQVLYCDGVWQILEVTKSVSARFIQQQATVLDGLQTSDFNGARRSLRAEAACWAMYAGPAIFSCVTGVMLDCHRVYCWEIRANCLGACLRRHSDLLMHAFFNS